MDADFGYAGYYAHRASGLWLTLFRAYDPDLGRWLSRDPIGERGGINIYKYAENNPICYIDSNGESALIIALGIGAIIIIGAATAYNKYESEKAQADADAAATAKDFANGDPSSLGTLGQSEMMGRNLQGVSDFAKESSGFTSAGGLPISIPDGTASDASGTIASTVLQSWDDIEGIGSRVKNWWSKKKIVHREKMIWECRDKNGYYLKESPTSPGPNWTLVKTVEE